MTFPPTTARGAVRGAVSGLAVRRDTRLRPILLNLLSNALEFTSGRRVAVDVDTEPDVERPKRMHVKIAVSDTGIGIPADRLERLIA